MDINLVEVINASPAFSYLLMLIAGVMTIVYVLALASLIYHWHYYGVGFFKRWLLLGIFGGVGLALVIAAWGLLFKLT